MPRKKKLLSDAEMAKIRDIEAYDHADKKRANNPPIGLAKKERVAEQMTQYAFDPHIDPTYGIKYGFFAHRAIKQFTLDELLAERKLPERAIKSIEANGGTVIRNYTKYEEFPPLNTIANLTDVIIHGHRPLLKENSDA